MKPSWYISRRTLLRGAGVAMALPFFDQMVAPKANAQALVPLRFAATFVPNGVYLPGFFPATEGVNYATSPILMPVEAIRNDVLILSGLDNSVAQPNGNMHTAGIAAFLTGAFEAGGPSLDQVIAQKTKGMTPFPSLEFHGGEEGIEGCEQPCYLHETLAWSAAGQGIAPERNPQAAFNRLVGSIPATVPSSTEPTPPVVDPKLAIRRSVLDAVQADATTLSAKLGPTDKAKLDAYLTAVREVEQRLAVGVTPGGGTTCSAPSSAPAPFADDYPARIKAFMDVTALALQCDLTRAVTFMLAGWESRHVFSFLGLKDQHHIAYSHHENNPTLVDGCTKIDRWEVEQFVYLATLLKGAMEPNGQSVLDNSALLFGSEVSDGNAHSRDNMPILVAGKLGGAIQSGRHLKATGPLANLYLSILQSFDPVASKFGNSTAALNLKA
ncbi:MAG: DUF1552 domain-containing protein [Polyangiaceae bacterium]|nr:DUF1552 domain-containing protein [Polyangiaceae bacterium]